MLRLGKGLVLAGVLATSSAMAADGKNYAGLDCHIVQGNGFIYSFGSIINPSTTTDMVLACPAVKDAANISSGAIVVRDQSLTSDVSCTLFSNHTSGSSIVGDTDGPRVSAPGTSPNWQSVSFGSVSATSNSAYWYLCTIPKANGSLQSGLAMYKIVEND